MLKPLVIFAAISSLGAILGYSGTTKVVIPVNRVAATSGHQMYSSYCAPCHGADGRGNGPAAAQLGAPLPDLTQLSRRNHGKFPESHVVSVLQFGVEGHAHPAPPMPAWGPILGKMDQSNPQDRLLRIANLSRYLDSIQTR